MVRQLKSIAFAALVPGLLLAGAACRGGEEGVTSPAPKTLTASLRSEPTSYLRYCEASAASDLLSLLTDARLLRVNRETDAIEPALATSWTQSSDGLTYTLALRRDVRFSDGAPFTSRDVLFTARAMYDPAVNSEVASAMQVGGKPLVFAAPDDFTVTMTLPGPFAPGLRLLDNMPILPRHKLEAALAAGQLRDTWKAGTPPTELAGLGPFKLTEHIAGQRLVFVRNPQYWRRDDAGAPLPRLDGLTVAIVPDQNAEAVKIDAGEIDLMSNGDIRPEDYSTYKRASDAGRLRLLNVGVGLDLNVLWFNLTPAGRARAPWLHDRRVRQAISYAVNRQAIADTVYLGEAVPVHGPVSPGDRTWASSSAPQYPHDPARAKELLAAAGFADRNGDGTLEARGGKPLRFSVLTQKGHLRERTAAVIQEHLRAIGITVDLVAVDANLLFAQWSKQDYDSIHFGFQSSATDPALNSEFWLSSGAFHLWNPRQKTPATEWEARVDDLMRRQAATAALPERQKLFAEVQRILGEELPAIYFVAPKVTIAVSTRVANPRPVLQIPQLLWSAETLGVAGK